MTIDPAIEENKGEAKLHQSGTYESIENPGDFAGSNFIGLNPEDNFLGGRVQVQDGCGWGVVPEPNAFFTAMDMASFYFGYFLDS